MHFNNNKNKENKVEKYKDGNVHLISIDKNNIETNNNTAILQDLDRKSTNSKSNKPVKRCFYSYFTNLEKQGLVKLDPEVFNLKTKAIYKYSDNVIYILCEKYRNKSDGIIKLCRPFYPYYYKNQHCTTEAHLVSIRLHEDAKRAKLKIKVKTYSQSMLHNYFAVVTEKTITEMSETNVNSNNDNSNVVNNDNNDKHNKSTSEISVRLEIQNTTSSTSSQSSTHGCRCVGIINSISRPKRNFVTNVHKYIRCNKTSCYKFGQFNGLPAIYSKDCIGIGSYKAIDGSLSHFYCLLLRRKPGNSIPVT